MKNLLFGYGTLRTDIHYGNASRYYNAKSIGFGRIVGELYQIKNAYGIWAGVKENPDSNLTVLGEVFALPNEEIWDRIDYREQTEKYSNPPFYYRKLVEAEMNNGNKLDVFIYFAGQQRTNWLQLVDHGDWKQFLDSQCKDKKICVDTP